MAPLRLLPLALKPDRANAVGRSSLEPRNRSVRASTDTGFLTTSWAGQYGVRSLELLRIGLALVLNTTECRTLDAR